MRAEIYVTVPDILRFLEIAVWPFLVAVALFYLRKEIKALLDRIKSVSAAGLTFDTVASQKGQEALEDNLKVLAEEVKRHKNIEEQLLKLNEETVQSRLAYQLAYHFERAYRLIFNSQLTVLIALSRSPEPGMNMALLQAIHRRTLLAATYSYDNWIGFLLNSQFILYRPQTDTYALSELGFMFINYLSENHLSLDKPGNL